MSQFFESYKWTLNYTSALAIIKQNLEVKNKLVSGRRNSVGLNQGV